MQHRTSPTLINMCRFFLISCRAQQRTKPMTTWRPLGLMGRKAGTTESTCVSRRQWSSTTANAKALLQPRDAHGSTSLVEALGLPIPRGLLVDTALTSQFCAPAILGLTHSFRSYDVDRSQSGSQLCFFGQSAPGLTRQRVWIYTEPGAVTLRATPEFWSDGPLLMGRRQWLQEKQIPSVEISVDCGKSGNTGREASKIAGI